MIRITTFSGEVPRLSPRHLPDHGAQRAYNCRLGSGALRGYRQRSSRHQTAPTTTTVYRHLGTWWEWAARVSVAPGPVAGDRLYVTGDGPPTVMTPGGDYPLKLLRPVEALAVSVIGTFDDQLASTYLYVYTAVTVLDEESEPSPVSDPVVLSPGMTVTLAGFTVAQPGRGIDRFRLYRSQTSSIGETTFHFIAELPTSQATFDDDLVSTPIQEVLPSATHHPPPDGLTGLISLPNGMMAAFDGRSLRFCEPYRPHAWPEQYTLTTDHPIVALGAFGSSVVVGTQGPPYVVTGTHPETMLMERLEVDLPCLSAHGLVDLGYAIAYPGSDGLVLVNAQGARVVSKALFSRDQWQDLRPGEMIAAAFDGQYVARVRNGTRTEVMLFDVLGDRPFITRLDVDNQGLDVDGLYTEAGTGRLFYVIDGQVWEFDAPDRPPDHVLWRSRPFVFGAPMSFGAMLVEGGGANVGTRVFVDGLPLIDTVERNRIVRLPAGRAGRVWEIEVEGAGDVSQIIVAPSPSDISAVL